MYLTHFELTEPLLADGLAQDAAVFSGGPHAALVTKLGIALTRRDAVAIVSGQPGVGKTTSITHALREMATRLALGSIDHPPASPHELLEQLLTEFGFTPYKQSRTERLQVWRQFLSEMAVTDTRVAILVEEADNLDPLVLATLERLTAANGSGSAGANLILTARTGSTELLRSSVLVPLAQRVRLRTEMPPLTVEQLEAYLKFVLERAGGDSTTILKDGAIEALYLYSQGILRLANTLLETSMALAASSGQKTVDAALVRTAAIEFCCVDSTDGTNVAPAEPQPEARPAAEVTSNSAPSTRLGKDQPAPTPVPPEPRRDPVEAISEAPLEATLTRTDIAKPTLETLTQTDIAQPAHEVLASPEPADAAAEDASKKQPGTGSARAANVIEPDSGLMLTPEFGEEYETSSGDSEDDDLSSQSMLLQMLLGAEKALEEAEIDVPEEEPKVATRPDVPTLTDPVPVAVEPDQTPPPKRSELPKLDSIADSAAFDMARIVEPSDTESADSTPARRLSPRHEVAEKGSANNDADSIDPEQTGMIEALANAKVLEDISNSMAETLFGDDELERLAATLAISKKESSDESDADLDDDAPGSRTAGAR